MPSGIFPSILGGVGVNIILFGSDVGIGVSNPIASRVAILAKASSFANMVFRESGERLVCSNCAVKKVI